MTIDRRFKLRFVAFICSLSLAACNTGGNSDLQYQTSINQHFKAFPACIWSQAKKFPVQAATADDAKTERYDALTHEGLLTRTTAEKKVFIVASKQVNNYDLSETGRTSWTPDSSQPGYGNFCYGNREVTSLPDLECSFLGTVARNADRLPEYRVRAWFERV
jgi:hypothetical protein